MTGKSLLDGWGVPRRDLRTKPKCTICGILVTRGNFAMASTEWEHGWGQLKYFCKDCFLKPEALAGSS